MANDQSSHLGLRPLDQPYGNRKVQYYRADTATAIYLYQPLTLTAQGTVAIASVLTPAPVIGVAVGFLDTNKASLPAAITALSSGSYLPANTDAFVKVVDDPNQLFIIEEGTSGTAIGRMDIGNGVVLTYLATTGDTTTGIANMVISQSSLTSTTSCTYQIVAVADLINSDGTSTTTGNFCKWILRTFQHQGNAGYLSVNI
jgi:hypothetical protein